MKVDMLIKNVKMFHTQQRKFVERHVSVLDGKFYLIHPHSIEEIETKQVIEAEGQYMLPGFIDCHIHIESSMTTPELFSEKVLTYGVTTVIADAHEVANVFGIEGLERFMSVPSTLDIFHAIPSSVPSTRPELETTGGIIGLQEVAQLLENPKVICLGEGMNFKGIAYEPDSLIKQIIDLVKSKRPTMPLEGHCPKISGEELSAFLSSGITSDHTHQFPENLKEKIEAGMFIQLQHKSLTKENMQVFNENQYYDYGAIITDDVMVDDFLKGHLNVNILKAVEMGLPLEQAIYMATATPARRMGLHDRGEIAPGRLADFMLVNDLDILDIQQVYKNGQLVYEKGEERRKSVPLAQFPTDYYQSITCKKLQLSDVQLKVATDLPEVKCHVIRKQAVGTFTERVVRSIPVIEGQLQWEEAGFSLLMVMERYGKNGNITYALVEEGLSEKGCVATTWAHDHHNLMLLGTSKEAILLAQHRLLAIQGGYLTANPETITAECPLPLGGILSQAPINVLGEQLKEVRAEMKKMGYKNGNEIMSFSTLSLPVSPAIKVTDVGILETKTQEFYPLIVEGEGELLNAHAN